MIEGSEVGFKENAFGVSDHRGGRELLLAADSNAERRAWIDTINNYARGTVEEAVEEEDLEQGGGGTYGAVKSPKKVVCEKTKAPIRVASAQEVVVKASRTVCRSWGLGPVDDEVAVNVREVMKVYAMEGAIAVHSVIVGFSLGVSTGDDIAIASLAFALAVHQFFEGIALGLAALEANISKPALFFLVAMFSTSIAAGVVVGVFVTSVEDSAGGVGGLNEALCRGVPNAVGGGMLSVIAGEFLNKDLGPQAGHKRSGSKLFLLFLGGTVMSVLAFWA